MPAGRGGNEIIRENKDSAEIPEVRKTGVQMDIIRALDFTEQEEPLARFEQTVKWVTYVKLASSGCF